MFAPFRGANGTLAVDGVHERARNSVEVVRAPADMPWGNRSLLLRDPDGVLVNVFAPLAGA